jgi:hypothetical protein
LDGAAGDLIALPCADLDDSAAIYPNRLLTMPASYEERTSHLVERLNAACLQKGGHTLCEYV